MTDMYTIISAEVIIKYLDATNEQEKRRADLPMLESRDQDLIKCCRRLINQSKMMY
jgi:hypothetical protein